MTGRIELMEDTDLAARLLEDDQSCLEELLRSFGGGILALLRRRFYDVLREEDFEDVLSMGLFRLWNARQRYDVAQASLRVWLYRICENAARDVLRMGWQKARALEISSDELLLGCSTARTDVLSVRDDVDHVSVNGMAALHVDELSAVHLDLNDVLSDLPEAQRIILLADAATRDGVACSQRLGDELGLPAATVRVYRKRALDRVRRELIARGHGPPESE